MAASGGSVAFGEDAALIAFSSADGTLKIYETLTGRLKQEFTPSAHLSATCTCLAWSCRRNRLPELTPRKKKKRKSSVALPDSQEGQLNLIAIGTVSGSVLLYSVAKGDLQSQMDGGHTDRVNDVCWKQEDDSIITCSDDRHIVEWSILTGKIKNKWKGDKGSVSALCTCPGRYLFAAGRSIKLWDLDKLEVLKSFTGHENEVSKLLFVNLHPSSGSSRVSAEDDADEDEVDVGERFSGAYLLSCARNERCVSVWHANPELTSKSSVATFALSDGVQTMSMVQPADSKQPLLLGAVTEAGQLVVFEHVLNGVVKKPIKAKATVQVAAQGSRRDEAPRQLPVLAAQLVSPRIGDSAGHLPSITLAYGGLLRPAFERLPCSFEAEPEVCLVRTDPMAAAAAVQEAASVSKVKVPVLPNDVTVSGPDSGAPRKPTQGADKDAAGRRKRKPSATPHEMTISERLHALGVDRPSTASSSTAQHPPKLDTLATLLAQGLQCSDKKILNTVLQTSDEKLVASTVRRLPVACVVPLVRELAGRMRGHAQSGRTLVRWLKTVLTVHTSYLVTFPDLVQSLGALYSMMDARTEMLPRVMKLQAKLDLMLSQVSASQAAEEDVDSSISGGQPLLYHRDSSSDEDMGDVDEMLISLSESEGEWGEPADSTADLKEDGDENE